MVLNPWSGFNHIITGVIMWVSFWYTFNILLRLHLSDSREPKRKRPVFPNCTMEHPIIHYYTFVFLYIFHPNLWTWYYYKWFSPLLLCTIAFVLILWKFFNCITTSSTPTEQFIRFYPWFCLLYLGTNTNDFLHFGCQRHWCICLCTDTFKIFVSWCYIFHPNWVIYWILSIILLTLLYKWYSPLLVVRHTGAFSSVQILLKFFFCGATSFTPTEGFIRFFP